MFANMNELGPRVIAETKDYLVIEKPAGLLAHPAPNTDEPTLLDFLAKKYPETKKIGDPNRAGLVHRLDRDVSGVMVIPRTPEMYEHLKKQFQERTIEKHYTALVHGNIKKEDGVINFPIGRSKRHGRMAARAEQGTEMQDGDREAETHFWVLDRRVGSTLLDIQIKTGRTHQIRTHLFAYGFPIIGDTIYHPKTTKLKRSPGRIFLHASRLAFTNLAGERVEYVSELPEILRAFLDTLGQAK